MWDGGHSAVSLTPVDCQSPVTQNGRFLVISLGLLCMVCCVSSPYRPCSEGGEPSRSSAFPFRTSKSCTQQKDASGSFLNHGRYFEYDEVERKRLEGFYEWGKKSGRWFEYDEKGKKISDTLFEEGRAVESLLPETKKSESSP